MTAIDHETVMDRAARVERETQPAICSICHQVLDHPELRGQMFHRKDGEGVSMSFSQTLVQIAGGIDALLEHWYIECPWCGNPASSPKFMHTMNDPGLCRNPFHGNSK